MWPRFVTSRRNGTGTAIGDPIEALALVRVFSSGRSKDTPWLIDSVKTNIGHLEAASGIASVIKVAMMLKHRMLAPHLHFREPNPRIPFAELGLRVPCRLEPWPDESNPGLAGVNSFGFGGTNAHVVMAQFVADGGNGQRAVPQPTSGPWLLPIAARNPEALRTLASSFLELLNEQGNAAR
jgi:acyl transferase domain-containing protein